METILIHFFKVAWLLQCHMKLRDIWNDSGSHWPKPLTPNTNPYPNPTLTLILALTRNPKP